MNSRVDVTFYLYVLKLVGGRFYVGMTGGPPGRRIDQHGSRRGAAWTRLHTPVELVETSNTRTSDRAIAEQKESLLTWTYMRKHGWRNVRGGFFCATDERQTELALRAHGYFEAVPEQDPVRETNKSVAERKLP